MILKHIPQHAGFVVVIAALAHNLSLADRYLHMVDKVREMAGWFNAALQDADVRKGLSDAAMESVQSTPAGFAATIKSDIERWAPVVRASGFTAEE